MNIIHPSTLQLSNNKNRNYMKIIYPFILQQYNSNNRSHMKIMHPSILQLSYNNNRNYMRNIHPSILQLSDNNNRIYMKIINTSILQLYEITTIGIIWGLYTPLYCYFLITTNMNYKEIMHSSILQLSDRRRKSKWVGCVWNNFNWVTTQEKLLCCCCYCV